jgi:hypothetical protein
MPAQEPVFESTPDLDSPVSIAACWSSLSLSLSLSSHQEPAKSELDQQFSVNVMVVENLTAGSSYLELLLPGRVSCP